MQIIKNFQEEVVIKNIKKQKGGDDNKVVVPQFSSSASEVGPVNNNSLSVDSNKSLLQNNADAKGDVINPNSNKIEGATQMSGGSNKVKWNCLSGGNKSKKT